MRSLALPGGGNVLNKINVAPCLHSSSRQMSHVAGFRIYYTFLFNTPYSLNCITIDSCT